VQSVPSRNEATNFPSHPSINFNHEPDGTVGLVLGEGIAVIRSNGDVSPVNKRRPDVNVLVTLVDWGYSGVVSDLLVSVNGVDVELVVVNADLVVGVP